MLLKFRTGFHNVIFVGRLMRLVRHFDLSRAYCNNSPNNRPKRQGYIGITILKDLLQPLSWNQGIWPACLSFRSFLGPGDDSSCGKDSCGQPQECASCAKGREVRHAHLNRCDWYLKKRHPLVQRTEWHMSHFEKNGLDGLLWRLALSWFR